MSALLPIDAPLYELIPIAKGRYPAPSAPP